MFYRRTGLRPTILPFLGALTLSLAMLSAQVAAETGSCEPTQVAYNVSMESASTTSFVYIPIRHTTVSFYQGGDAPSCVIVTFSGEASTFVGDNGRIRVGPVLDGDIHSIPPVIQILDDTNGNPKPYAAHFIFPSVSPGRHTIKMYGSVFRGEANLSFHNVIVQHAK
jgi:hypothetical protein